jgi:hypothetical protein
MVPYLPTIVETKNVQDSINTLYSFLLYAKEKSNA